MAFFKNYLYFTEDGPHYNDIVQVINTSSYSVVSTITVGISPYGDAYDPINGEIYVANSVSGSISLIAPTSNSVIGVVNLGSAFCSRPYYDPYVDLVYVADGISGVVIIANETILERMPVGTSCYDLAYDSFDGKFFVTNELSNSVTEFSPNLTGTPLATNTTTTPGFGYFAFFLGGLVGSGATLAMVAAANVVWRRRGTL